MPCGIVEPNGSFRGVWTLPCGGDESFTGSGVVANQATSMCVWGRAGWVGVGGGGGEAPWGHSRWEQSGPSYMVKQVQVLSGLHVPCWLHRLAHWAVTVGGKQPPSANSRVAVVKNRRDTTGIAMLRVESNPKFPLSSSCLQRDVHSQSGRHRCVQAGT